MEEATPKSPVVVVDDDDDDVNADNANEKNANINKELNNKKTEHEAENGDKKIAQETIDKMINDALGSLVDDSNTCNAANITEKNNTSTTDGNNTPSQMPRADQIVYDAEKVVNSTMDEIKKTASDDTKTIDVGAERNVTNTDSTLSSAPVSIPLKRREARIATLRSAAFSPPPSSPKENNSEETLTTLSATQEAPKDEAPNIPEHRQQE